MKATYHKTHSYISKQGLRVTFISQLYDIGIYFIINNDPQTQRVISPNGLEKIEKRLKKEEEKGEIKDLELKLPITVTNESGLWKEVKKK